MTDWKITNESRAAALKLMEGFGKARQAFEVLAVPVGEAEGWAEVNPKFDTAIREFKNNQYLLTAWNTTPHWYLYLMGEDGEVKTFWSNGKIIRIAILETQAWADGVIKERETGEKKICSQCGLPFAERACGPTHAMIANEKKQPKPIAPGSEFQMSNGDLVRVVRDSYDGDLVAVNITTNECLRLGDDQWWWTDSDDLRSALEAAGAKIL